MSKKLIKRELLKWRAKLKTYKKATNKVKAEAKKVKEAGEVLTK